jgi:hypothetical protein
VPQEEIRQFVCVCLEIGDVDVGEMLPSDVANHARKLNIVAGTVVIWQRQAQLFQLRCSAYQTKERWSKMLRISFLASD